MREVLGYRIFDNGVPLFVQRPHHAKFAVQQVIERTDPNSVMRKEGNIIVMPITEYAKCSPFVVMYNVPDRQVWRCRWTPGSPIEIEEDHQRVRRFRVVGFFETTEAADACVEKWAEKHNYNQYRS